jgi:hypothetical protein
VIAVAFRAEITRDDALLAEAHLLRELVDLCADEPKEPRVRSFTAVSRLALAERHQLRPPLVQRGDLRHGRAAFTTAPLRAGYEMASTIPCQARTVS